MEYQGFCVIVNDLVMGKFPLVSVAVVVAAIVVGKAVYSLWHLGRARIDCEPSKHNAREHLQEQLSVEPLE